MSRKFQTMLRKNQKPKKQFIKKRCKRQEKRRRIIKVKPFATNERSLDILSLNVLLWTRSNTKRSSRKRKVCWQHVMILDLSSSEEEEATKKANLCLMASAILDEEFIEINLSFLELQDAFDRNLLFSPLCMKHYKRGFWKWQKILKMFVLKTKGSIRKTKRSRLSVIANDW